MNKSIPIGIGIAIIAIAVAFGLLFSQDQERPNAQQASTDESFSADDSISATTSEGKVIIITLQDGVGASENP